MRTTLYYDIIELFPGETCPICSLLSDRMGGCMDYFLYEKVNNGIIRKEINDNSGFCNRHSSALMKFGDPLSHAQIYSDILKKELAVFGKVDLSGFSDKGNCYFCNEEKRFERDICESFAVSLSEEDFCERFKSDNSYLCNYHFTKVKECCDDLHLSYNKRLIEEYEKNAVQSILDGLEEIKIKHDYRNTGENISAQAKRSWRRAVNLLSGFEGVDIKVKRR